MGGDKSLLLERADWGRMGGWSISPCCDPGGRSVMYLSQPCSILDSAWWKVDPRIRDFGPKLEVLTSMEDEMELVNFSELVSANGLKFPV